MSIHLNLPWLAGGTALVMALGTLRRAPGFGFIYRWILKPRGWARPAIVLDNPEPHRFAQGVGGTVLAAFIIDSSGRPRRVNHGVQRAGALQKQIIEVELNRSLKLSALRGGS